MGILFTVFVSWTIATLALAQFFFYLRKRDVIALNVHRQSLFFSLFWLCIGVVWLFAGASDVFAYWERVDEAYAATILLQIAVGLSIVSLGCFFAVRAKSLAVQWSIALPLAGVAVAFMGSVITYGLEQNPVVSFFSHQYLLHPVSAMIFRLGFFPLVVMSLFFFVQGVVGWRTAVVERRFILSAAISLLLLQLGGGLEEFGELENIFIPIARICSLVGAMSAYIATTSVIEIQNVRRELVL